MEPSVENVGTVGIGIGRRSGGFKTVGLTRDVGAVELSGLSDRT